jgi:hypothetical protein
MQFDQPFSHAFGFLQDRYDFVQLQAHSLDHAGELSGRLSRS